MKKLEKEEGSGQEDDEPDEEDSDEVCGGGVWTVGQTGYWVGVLVDWEMSSRTP